MSKPAARLTDMHVCPMQTPAVVPIPHVGGPILFPGEPRVLIGGLPAARVGDFCFCVGPPAPIVLGSFTVLIGGKPAARVGDMTGHGGTIMPPGCPTVLIGDAGGGAGTPAAFTMGGARASGSAFTRTNCQSEAGRKAVEGSALLATGDPDKKSWIEIELVDQHGKPVPHERYRVVPPGEKPMEGFLDEKGFARVSGIDPGTCRISFPDFDAASWKPEKGDPGHLSKPVPVVTYRPGVGQVTARPRHVGRPSVGPVTVAVRVFTLPSVGPVETRIITPGVGPVTVHVGGRPRIQLHDDQYQFCRQVTVKVIRADGTEQTATTDGRGFVELPDEKDEVTLEWTSSDGTESYRARVQVPATELSEEAWYLAHLRNWGFAKGDQDAKATVLRFQATSAQLALTGELDEPTRSEIDRLRSGPMSGLVKELPEAVADDDAPGAKRRPVGMAAPEALYYLAIDGTRAMDSAVYGDLLEKRNWYNLAHFLDPAPDDANRLVDPEHPYLPICLFEAPGRRRKVAVICPSGRDASGKDGFWRQYQGELPEEQPNGKKNWEEKDREGNDRITYGRHSALEKSYRYINRLFFCPVIETVPDPARPNALRAHFFGSLAGDLPADRTSQPFRADLLFVSSHGFLGGYARGDGPGDWAQAEPEEARANYFPVSPLFSIAKQVAAGEAFFGPQWIILAQCSTLNESTWEAWVTAMARSVPPVRGILAYEEASPGVEGSVTIAQRFFGNLEKMSMVDAWRAANQGEKWAAIVHRDALGDRLQKWRQFKPLNLSGAPLVEGEFLGFVANEKPRPIRTATPKFAVRLEQRMDPFGKKPQPEGPWVEVTPESHGEESSYLWGEHAYRVTVTPPAGRRLQAASIRWIHIRPTYNPQVAVEKVFRDFAIPPEIAGVGLEVSKPDVFSMVATASGQPVDRIQFRFDSRSDNELFKAHLDPLHSYLWLRVSVKFDDGTSESADLKTLGLEWG